MSSYSEQYEKARDGINRYSATYSDLQKHQVIPSKFKIPGMCVRVCVCGCVRACVCVGACVRACVHTFACVGTLDNLALSTTLHVQTAQCKI